MELRKDIEEMENEKEIVAKRVERMQRKASNWTVINIPEMMILMMR